MKLQLLSDLHLETEAFEPLPAPGAELLVLAGDIIVLFVFWEGTSITSFLLVAYKSNYPEARAGASLPTRLTRPV